MCLYYHHSFRYHPSAYFLRIKNTFKFIITLINKIQNQNHKLFSTDLVILPIENHTQPIMYPLIDDVGGFPFPDFVQPDNFNNLYWQAYRGIVRGFDVRQNRGIKNLIYQLEDSFKKKIESGLDIITYPQFIDMCTQFLKPIEDYEQEPFLIEPSKAKVIEVQLLRDFAANYFEETGSKVKLKVCVTGPLELYQRKIGFAVYKDMAINLAKSVGDFIKSSIVNEKYMETAVISVDEPSIGLVDFTQISRDDITDILNHCFRAFNNSGGLFDSQIHLHSLNAYDIALNVDSLDVLTCEYASNQNNTIPKRELEKYDKFIRVGVSRTNIDSIISEEIDKGRNPREFETENGILSIIDTSERIQKRYKEAVSLYGDRLKYVGPDCGLKSWNNQRVAFEVLNRTVKAIKAVRQLN